MNFADHKRSLWKKWRGGGGKQIFVQGSFYFSYSSLRASSGLAFEKVEKRKEITEVIRLAVHICVENNILYMP